MNLDSKPKLIAANWKMNGSRHSLIELDEIVAGAPPVEAAQLIICPPLTLLIPFVDRTVGSPVIIGAQDCALHENYGARTGEISTTMIADAGAQAVILGHSERRIGNGEGSALVAEKAIRAWRAGLRTLICIGETREDYETGAARRVLIRQIADSVPAGATEANTIVVYEPIWSIGTGFVPQVAELKELFAYLRSVLIARFKDGVNIPLLYGGSVTSGNAGSILSVGHIDGLLIGKASLEAKNFLGIAHATVNAAALQ